MSRCPTYSALACISASRISHCRASTLISADCRVLSMQRNSSSTIQHSPRSLMLWCYAVLRKHDSASNLNITTSLRPHWKTSSFRRYKKVFTAYPSLIRAPVSSFFDKLVKYHIKASYLGELIFTALGAYHKTINFGENMAEIVIYVVRIIPPYPPDYRFFSGDACGFEGSINPYHFRPNKRPRLEDRVTETSLNKKHCDHITGIGLVQLQRQSLRVVEHLFYGPEHKSPAALIVTTYHQ
jgi:hypothetical protein